MALSYTIFMNFIIQFIKNGILNVLNSEKVYNTIYAISFQIITKIAAEIIEGLLGTDD